MVGEIKLPGLLPRGADSSLVLGNALGHMPTIAAPGATPVALAPIDSFVPPATAVHMLWNHPVPVARAPDPATWANEYVKSYHELNAPWRYTFAVVACERLQTEDGRAVANALCEKAISIWYEWVDLHVKSSERIKFCVADAKDCERLQTDGARNIADNLYRYAANVHRKAAEKKIRDGNVAAAIELLTRAADVPQVGRHLVCTRTSLALRSGQMDMAIDVAPTPGLAQRLARWKAVIDLDERATRSVVISVSDMEALIARLPDVAARDGMYRALRLLQQGVIELADHEFAAVADRYDATDATMQLMHTGWSVLRATLVGEPVESSNRVSVVRAMRALRRVSSWWKEKEAIWIRNRDVSNLSKSVRSFTKALHKDVTNIAVLESSVRTMAETLFPRAMGHGDPSTCFSAIAWVVESCQSAKETRQGHKGQSVGLYEELALQQARLLVLQGIAALYSFNPDGAHTHFESAAVYFAEARAEGKAAEARAFAQVARRWIEAPTDAAAPIPAAATLAERFASYGTDQLNHGYAQAAVQSFWWAAELFLQAGEAERAGGAARQAIALMNRRPEAIAGQLQLAAIPASPDLTDAPVDEVSHTGDAPSTSTPVPEDV